MFSQTIEEIKSIDLSGTKPICRGLIYRDSFALSLLYQDSDDVIKYINENKKIVVKAQALVPVLDAYKLMNPNETVLTDYVDYSHNYTVIIQVKMRDIVSNLSIKMENIQTQILLNTNYLFLLEWTLRPKT